MGEAAVGEPCLEGGPASGEVGRLWSAGEHERQHCDRRRVEHRDLDRGCSPDAGGKRFQWELRLSSRSTARLLLPRVTSDWKSPFTVSVTPCGGGLLPSETTVREPVLSFT
jgi:hypothetical protein